MTDSRNLVIAKIQRSLSLQTSKEAEVVFSQVIRAKENTLFENLTKDGFSIKLNSLCKLP